MKNKIKIIVTRKGKSLEAELDLEHYIEVKQEGQQSVTDSIVNSLIEQFKK